MDSVFNKPFGSLVGLGVSYEGSKIRSKGRCACCGLPLKDNEMTVHHLLPEHIGGTNLANLVVVCGRCAKYRGLNSFTSPAVHLDLATDYPYLTKNERLRSIHFMEETLSDYLFRSSWTPPGVGTPNGEIEDSTPDAEDIFTTEGVDFLSSEADNSDKVKPDDSENDVESWDEDDSEDWDEADQESPETLF